MFICVCSSLCTIVAHNTAQNRPDNFPSCPPDNRHCSDDVYLREGGRPVLEYACPVWHSGLTAGQCNVIENIQKRAICMVYSDTDYETALIVARMNSLKDRCEMLFSRFFKKQVLPSNALLHYLLPE